MVTVLGIDPGLSGAWAIIVDGALTRVDDLPVIGAARQTRLNGGQMADLWAMARPSYAIIEAVHSMPKQGVASSFKFGYACGQILGVIEGLNIPLAFVTPQRWKKDIGLTADKEQARLKAIEAFPARREDFARKKDHQRAEAALIARWGYVYHDQWGLKR